MKKVMMNNPWKNMPPSTQRRVNLNSNTDLFWIKDIEGRYGFYIKALSKNSDNYEKIKLKGVLILRKVNNNYKELFLILNKKEDWELFFSLCNDLISLSKLYENEALFSAIEIRLKRWQLFLKKNNKIDFSLQQQMGLFSELHLLSEILTPNIGIDNAIESWVGCDFDKQDFLLKNMLIEVKSIKTSKIKIITINSAQQLYSEKEPLYLAVYNLTPIIENGKDIDDIINNIKFLLQNKPIELLQKFEDKLINYGYFHNMNIKKYKFIIDNIYFYKVTESFPKITPKIIESSIVKLNYGIDLYQCENFKINKIKF